MTADCHPKRADQVAAPRTLVPIDDTNPHQDQLGEKLPAEAFDAAPPGVKLLVVVGTGLRPASAERLAKAVVEAISLIAVAPEPTLTAGFGITVDWDAAIIQG